MTSPSSPDLPSVKIQFPNGEPCLHKRDWVRPAGVLMRDQNGGDEHIHSLKVTQGQGDGRPEVEESVGVPWWEGPGGPNALTVSRQSLG